jgi:hypothetical protein
LINLGFITEGRLATVLIIPSSWGSQRAVLTSHHLQEGNNAKLSTVESKSTWVFTLESSHGKEHLNDILKRKAAPVGVAVSGSKHRAFAR